MTPEERESLKSLADAIDGAAAVMSETSRAIGIEWSMDDAQDLIRDAFKEACSLVMIDVFKQLLDPTKPK